MVWEAQDSLLHRVKHVEEEIPISGEPWFLSHSQPRRPVGHSTAIALAKDAGVPGMEAGDCKIWLGESSICFVPKEKAVQRGSGEDSAPVLSFLGPSPSKSLPSREMLR